MYYIYHIPGVKIGCTEDYPRRAKMQSKVYELLETHLDIDIASDRELELQEQYGYRVDKVPYNIVKFKNSNAGSIGGKIGGRKTIHLASEARKKLTEEEVAEVKSKYLNGNYTMRTLGEEYDVSPPTIYRIVRNLTYTKKGHSFE